MAGGADNDTYLVDDVGDIVTEASGAGTDTVQSAITYTLPANVENLTLVSLAVINGIGNALNNILVGNPVNNALEGGAGSDTLYGGSGDDSLSGGAGADSMAGGADNDTYVVDDAGDAVTENANAGSDTVQSSVSYTLPANVENLALTGAGNINGTGNDLNNALTGSAAINTLEGGAGIDILFGGASADSFVLGTTTGGADLIKDFLSGTDLILFRDSVGSLGIGDKDHLIDGGVVRNAPGGFANTAELVIETANIAGAITTTSAAAAIGSATSAYAVGDVRLFAVDNGIDSALFLFKAAGADALVSAGELTLLGTLQGTAQTALADYGFIA